MTFGYEITEELTGNVEDDIDEKEFTVWEIDGTDRTIVCTTIAENPYYPELIVRALTKLIPQESGEKCLNCNGKGTYMGDVNPEISNDYDEIECEECHGTGVAE